MSRGRRPGETGLAISVTDGRGAPVRDGGLGRWLARVAPSRVRGEVAIALVSDARMRRLNRSYRRKDYATDVLSFRADPEIQEPPDPRGLGRRGRDGGTHRPTLGDLVIATGIARRQAREAGHSYQTELRVLALHGLLHLLGYDHEHPKDGGRMKRVERRLRRKGRLTAGLIQRSEGGTRPRLRPRGGAREGARAGVGPGGQERQ